MNGIIDNIANHWSVTETSLTSVLTDLNRSGTSITNGLDCFHSGYTWNTGDQEVDYWWPQGVTGSSDAYDAGTFDGQKLMMVSWYHKAEEDSSTSQYKGVRVSLVRHTSLSNVKYRHLLLAEPTAGSAGLKPLASSTSSVHAGGIVWYKNWLYVAHTSKGLRMFDMSRILAVQTGNKDVIGLDGADGYYGYGYAYVIPEVERYNRCDEGCCVRFSYVSLDRSTSPPSLLTGEYVSNSEVGRLMRWPLDPETGYLQETDGAVVASQVLFTGKEKIQGALSVDGTYFLSSSASKLSWPPALGTFYHGTLGQTLQDHAYPSLPEDLYYRPTTDEIWTCTEKPANILGNTRYCFSFLKSDVLGGCQ
jgi:hypothetical protein